MMNTLLTSVLVSTMCMFGTKLKIMDSSFKEIAPGVSTGYVVTKYEVQISSNNNKKVSIQDVWLKNRKASWELFNANNEKVAYINDKEMYTLRGQIEAKMDGVPVKSNSDEGKETTGSYEEDFVLRYAVGNGTEKCIKIDKIENLELVKTQ